MVRTDGYGRAKVKDVSLFHDDHPFRDPWATAAVGRPATRRARSAPLRRTATGGDASGRARRGGGSADADEFISREWRRSPWGGFEEMAIAAPTSALDGKRRGLPAQDHRAAGMGRQRPYARTPPRPRPKSARPHSVGRYGGTSGSTDWLTFRSENRSELAEQGGHPHRRGEVARKNVRAREALRRRTGRRLDRRLERALGYLRERDGHREKPDPDPDGREVAAAAKAVVEAEEQRWRDEQQRHEQPPRPDARAPGPERREADYSEGVSQALFAAREEGMRARLHELHQQELARRDARDPTGFHTGPLPSPVAGGYPRAERRTAEDVWIAQVLAQQRALASERAHADMLRQRRAFAACRPWSQLQGLGLTACRVLGSASGAAQPAPGLEQRAPRSAHPRGEPRVLRRRAHRAARTAALRRGCRDHGGTVRRGPTAVGGAQRDACGLGVLAAVAGR